MDEPTYRPDSVGRVSAPAAIHLRGTVAGALMRPTRGLGRAALERPRRHGGAVPSWPCSGWGLPSRRSHLRRWWSLTPPFHPCPHPSPAYVVRDRRAAGGLSLWHCPASHLGWVLPTTPLCGVRTFLGERVASPDAAARPAHPRSRVATSPGHFPWLSVTSNRFEPMRSDPIPGEHGIAARLR